MASEVKSLSRQATDATEQISKEIQSMQDVSNNVVGALDVIKKSIESVRLYVTGTASSVEEQSAVAQEMSANMQTAAGSVASISGSIDEIAAEHLKLAEGCPGLYRPQREMADTVVA